MEVLNTLFADVVELPRCFDLKSSTIINCVNTQGRICTQACKKKNGIRSVCRMHPETDPIVSVNMYSVNLCKGIL